MPSTVNSLCRVLLGAAFIFAGLTKAVDPMGGAIQLGEYFSAYGLEWLRGSEYALAIASATLELTLGGLLIVGLWPRSVAVATLAAMVFFTGLTLNIALTNPVEDCGCFGEALKLTNWQTFWKNAALLLPLSIVLLILSRRALAKKRTSRAKFLWPALFVLLGVGPGLWALRHLPIVDFLPYPVGTDLLAVPAASEGETTLIYRNISTGEQREFALADTTWWDEATWAYVDTKVAAADAPRGETFAILDGGQEVTRAVLGEAGEVWLLCVSDPATLPAEVERALANAADQAPRAVALTPAPLAGGEAPGGIPYYNMDDTTLKSLLRAPYGVVVVREGVVAKKYRWSDIP